MTSYLTKRLVERTEDYVEIATRYPLWDAVPDHRRVTKAHIVAQHESRAACWLRYKPEATPEDRAANKAACAERIKEDAKRLVNHQGCPVAVQWPEIKANRFAPCNRPVPGPGELCAIHGGDSIKAKPPSRSELLAEVERLRALVGES